MKSLLLCVNESEKNVIKSFIAATDKLNDLYASHTNSLTVHISTHSGIDINVGLIDGLVQQFFKNKYILTEQKAVSYRIEPIKGRVVEEHFRRMRRTPVVTNWGGFGDPEKHTQKDKSLAPQVDIKYLAKNLIIVTNGDPEELQKQIEGILKNLNSQENEKQQFQKTRK